MGMNDRDLDRLLELYNGEWGGDVGRVYRDCAY